MWAFILSISHVFKPPDLDGFYVMDLLCELKEHRETLVSRGHMGYNDKKHGPGAPRAGALRGAGEYVRGYDGYH